MKKGKQWFLSLLAQARQSGLCSLHTDRYYAPKFATSVSGAFVLHNGVTWFDLSASKYGAEGIGGQVVG